MIDRGCWHRKKVCWDGEKIGWHKFGGLWPNMVRPAAIMISDKKIVSCHKECDAGIGVWAAGVADKATDIGSRVSRAYAGSIILPSPAQIRGGLLIG
jgi:hypothetical protein